MLTTLLVVCVAGATRGAVLGSQNLTAEALVLEEQGASKMGAVKAKQSARQSVVVQVEQSDAPSPVIKDLKALDQPGIEAPKANKLTFGWSPKAVPGGLEVAVVTVTGDDLPSVDTPLLPPELAALMPRPKHDEFQFELIPPSRRRYRHRDLRMDPIQPPPTPVAPTADDGASGNATVANITTIYNSITDKRHKLERFKDFFNINSELLKHLIQKKDLQENMTLASDELVAAAINGLTDFRRSGRGRKGHGQKGQRGHRFRAESSDDETSKEQDTKERHVVRPLDGKQLDLAPARGGHIAAMRLKGRLCMRHVLFPEGPKYDKLGRIYAMASKSSEQFSSKAPNFIIPVCCNCCAKSVLGCE